MSQDLYHQQLLEYARNPQNKGRLEKFNATAKSVNASCGDSIEIFFNLDENKKIKNYSWEGHGCIISQAAASVFSAMIMGNDFEEINKITEEVLLKKLGLNEISQGRRRCLNLIIEVVSKIEQY